MKRDSFKYFAIAILLLPVLSSCNKDSEVSNQVFTDSYIHSVFNTKDTVESLRFPIYSVLHTAFSYTNMGSVKVTGISGQITNLTNADNTGLFFYNPTGDSASYKSAVPAAETFTYGVTYASGEIAAQTDATIDKSLAPARNLNAVKTITQIQVSWKPVANSEAYKLRIHSEDPTSKVVTLIYESDFLVPINPNAVLSINFPLANFSSFINTNLYFETSAYIFQQSHDAYHAVSETTIKRNFGI